MRNLFADKAFVRYLLKFALIFLVCYLGVLAMIGLASPGRYYSAFIDHHLNLVHAWRMGLIHASKGLLSLSGYETYYTGYRFRLVNGNGVLVSYSCMGYGVISFWTAFVLASPGKLSFRLAWLLGGIILITILNITRISLLLLALNKGWPMPAGLDHHTLFNVAAYILIFIGIYFFNRHIDNRQESLHGH